MKPHDHAPNGIFCEGIILYGSPERGATATKGFWLEPPDGRGASIDRLNALQDQVRALLALVGPGRRMQVQWWPDGNYGPELAGYHHATQSTLLPVVREARNERVARYGERMQHRGLRRERLAVFLGIEITRYSGNIQTAGGLKAHYSTLLTELQAQFEEFAGTMRTAFQGEAIVRPMDDQAHCDCLRDFLNPGLAARSATPVPCEPALTVQEQCWLSDGIGQPEGGFCLDGFHHAVLTLSRWPQRTRPGIITHLTGLPFLDYRITVNLTPAVSRGEILREEKAIERLQGEYTDQRRHSLLVAMRKKERKVENLS
ncbi:MAG: hypothetical protein QG602_2116, partial [Verrucomicrobiota bacterium]|nr:hypothetical protein [Verrucomicrobiota bacterium]